MNCQCGFRDGTSRCIIGSLSEMSPTLCAYACHGPRSPAPPSWFCRVARVLGTELPHNRTCLRSCFLSLWNLMGSDKAEVSPSPGCCEWQCRAAARRFVAPPFFAFCYELPLTIAHASECSRFLSRHALNSNLQRRPPMRSVIIFPSKAIQAMLASDDFVLRHKCMSRTM